MSRFLFLVNPAGHGGAALDAWEEFRSLWPDAIDSEDVLLTERAGHARDIARSPGRHDTLVAVGGDGTVNEILSGLLDRGDPRARMAIVPAGTGNDIARHVGITSVADGVRALREGSAEAYDVIRVHWEADGPPQRGYAFLQGAVGFSGSRGVRPWMKRLLGATGAYYLGTLLQIVSYSGPGMTIRADERRFSSPTWMVVVGNAEWTSGGSMRLSPGARTDDGLANVTIIPVQKSKLHMAMRMMPKVGTGEHVRMGDVRYFTARAVDVQCDGPASLDLDGDVYEVAQATFTVLPRAVELLSLPDGTEPASA